MSSLLILAAETVYVARFPLPAPNLWLALLYLLIFGILGIFLTVLGFKVFDWTLKKVDVEKELAEKQNIAVAIVVAAVILGVAIVSTLR